jgi:transposase-like protein
MKKTEVKKLSDFKQLVTEGYSCYSTNRLYEDNEEQQLNVDYFKLSPIEFAKKYRYLVFRPALILDSNKLSVNLIQMNYCTNPFCTNYGLPQERYINISNKPSRYRLAGSESKKRLCCNDTPLELDREATFNCWSSTMSNWSIADEIRRLHLINKVINFEGKYEFHKNGCSNSGKTPFNNKESFYRRGRSTGNSEKWQCKGCKKFTNVLPKYSNNLSYNQKKNEVLPLFIELLVSRVPVRRTCEILNIGSKTYYHKLEWVYRKCLEFLERHESTTFKKKQMDNIWVNTDKLIYNLNNVRKRGKGGIYHDSTEDKIFQTHILVSSNVETRYVFRADIAYDFNIKLEDIEKETEVYHDDHLYGYAQKNDRLRFPYSPQPPTENDTQTYWEYKNSLGEYNRRKNYSDGCHVVSTYTAVAHFYLLKRLLNCNTWCFVTDEDNTLIDPIMRVYKDEIKSKKTHAFTCRVDKTLDLKESRHKSRLARAELYKWAKQNSIEGSSLNDIASMKLADELKSHKFFDFIEKNGKKYAFRAKNPIKHPSPSIDEGTRFVDCLTDLSDKSPTELASNLLKVNSHATDDFFKIIRRRISILERPLATARGDGKSYIYSNYNPKYAQYAVTILRTLYNFCWELKTRDSESLTPAQRIGIANRKYDIEDILYFK